MYKPVQIRWVLARSPEVPVVLDVTPDRFNPLPRAPTPCWKRLVGGYGGKFVLAKVDADENMRIAGRHQAKGFVSPIAYSRECGHGAFPRARTEGFLRGTLIRSGRRRACRQGAVLAPAPALASTLDTPANGGLVGSDFTFVNERHPMNIPERDGDGSQTDLNA
ncbi:hypothetical protein [Candidatus Skiveiella danica]|uniref:hypothetical protein n=1 Tax=Candidatus Skiveiella danica TaxID=3386177 RepID=UPI0039B96A53